MCLKEKQAKISIDSIKKQFQLVRLRDQLANQQN